MTRQGTRRLDFGCSEQGKLPAAKAFRLAERDKHMSEEKTFMEQLDEWTNDTIIVPLGHACFEGPDGQYQAVSAQIVKAVREKVLESYRNGLKAKPRTFPQPKGNR